MRTCENKARRRQNSIFSETFGHGVRACLRGYRVDSRILLTSSSCSINRQRPVSPPAAEPGRNTAPPPHHGVTAVTPPWGGSPLRHQKDPDSSAVSDNYRRSPCTPGGNIWVRNRDE